MKPTLIDRVLLELAPRRAVDRIRARALATTLLRHFEAAQGGRRTEGWKRSSTDANSAHGPALPALRNHARDLVRNNPWASRGKQVIANNTVGWGIKGNPLGEPNSHSVKRARKLWTAWAETTECDVTGQRDIFGLQHLVMETVAESGEAIIRGYHRKLSDGLSIPLQLQVLEPDHLDTTRDGLRTADGGRIIQGVEFDARGRIVAYWLFPEHPGASFQMGGSRLGVSASQRVPAEYVRQVFRGRRPGQVRGFTWYAPVIVKLKDFDEFEDAQLLRQKIAACLAAIVTDMDGTTLSLGEKSENDPLAQMLEPGTVMSVPMGKTVTMTDPPQVAEGTFHDRTLRAIASGLGITYEDLTGDYRKVNFSSARMSRLAHWSNVHDWRWNMLIPMFCTPVWGWAMEAAMLAGSITDVPAVKWTPPPMPMIEPDKEGQAYSRLVRNGVMTIDDVILEQGGDPDVHFDAYAACNDRLDRLKIVLDSDPRKTTQAGNPTTMPAGASAKTDPA